MGLLLFLDLFVSVWKAVADTDPAISALHLLDSRLQAAASYVVFMSEI